MSLERIVRPFATTDVTPPQRIIDPTVVVVPNLLLQIGMVGATKTLNGSFSATIDAYSDDAHKEIARTTEIKRVTNPDDPSQFLEVENVKKLTTEKGSADTYKKSTYELKNT